MSKLPALSIVVPAYKAAEVLPLCLAGLAEQTADEDSYEVLVVDDGSGEQLAELVEAPARLLRHDRNRGAAAARNTGAAQARAQLLLFIDADLIPEPSLVSSTLELFAGDQPPSAATGCYSPEPANDRAFAHYKALWTWHCWQQTGAQTGTSSHLQGAVAAISRDLFEQLGGFDEGYRGGNVEDYELSQRLRQAGHQIAFDMRMCGRHHFPGFVAVARNYWNRTRMWLRLKRAGMSFSSGQANRRSGAAAVLALGAGILHLLTAALPVALFAALALDLAFVALLAPFLSLAAKRRGLLFALYCCLCHYLLSIVIGLAALSSPLGRGSRDRRLEGDREPLVTSSTGRA